MLEGESPTQPPNALNLDLDLDMAAEGETSRLLSGALTTGVSLPPPL